MSTVPDAPLPPTSTAALPDLIGARVERIDLPERELLAITLYEGPGEKRVLLIAFGTELQAVGLSEERPRGDPATGFARRLRMAFDNARLSSARWLGVANERATALALTFTRKEIATQLIADFDARAPNLLLADGDARVLGAADEKRARERFGARPYSFSPGRGRGVPTADAREALLAAGRTFLASRADGSEDRARGALKQAAKNARRKVARRVEAISGDVARASALPVLRHEANLILCHLAAIPRGAQSVELLDETVDPAVIRAIALDPARDARANAEARFDRARKVERGMGIARTRLAAAEREIEALDALLAEVDEAPLDTVRELAVGAALTLPDAAATKPRRAAGPPAHVAFRTFVASNGRPIYVGKGGADNDTLTLTVARPHDLWLHARSVQGAHVVIPCAKGTPAPAEQVLDAAHLAAHFSDARGESSAEIQIAERRHVRKPKGTAPGLVLVDRERVLLLRVEAARLQRLLAAETRK